MEVTYDRRQPNVSRQCDCCKRCTVIIGKGEPRQNGIDSMPPPERLELLRDHLGTLVDAAATFDAIDPERLTAVEFVTWLQPEVLRRDWYLGTRVEPGRKVPAS